MGSGAQARKRALGCVCGPCASPSWPPSATGSGCRRPRKLLLLLDNGRLLHGCCGLLWPFMVTEAARKWQQSRDEGACVLRSTGRAEAPWSGGGRESDHAMMIRVTNPSTASGAERSSKSRRHMASTVIGKQVCTSNKEPLLDSGVRHLSPPTDPLRTHAPASRSSQSRGGTSSSSPLGAVSSRRAQSPKRCRPAVANDPTVAAHSASMSGWPSSSTAIDAATLPPAAAPAAAAAATHGGQRQKKGRKTPPYRGTGGKQPVARRTIRVISGYYTSPNAPNVRTLNCHIEIPLGDMASAGMLGQ